MMLSFSSSTNFTFLVRPVKGNKFNSLKEHVKLRETVIMDAIYHPSDQG